MPLRVIRNPIKAREVLFAATAFASVTVDVSDMVQFTPVRAAAGILLVILQTIQEMDANKDACFRLARRAAKILLDLKKRMEGRWENAPRSLIENIEEFEKVLIVIRDYMKGLTKLKWMGRLLNKHNIEDALAEYSTMLDEAERGFQTATLIEIHLSVNMLQQQQRLIGSVSMPEPEPAPPASDESNLPIPPPYSLEGAHPVLSVDITTQENGLAQGRAEVASSETQTQTVSEIDELVKELRTIEKSGFKRYHQPDVRLKSSTNSSTGFWSDSSYAEVDGRQAIVKRYDRNEAASRWINDIKRLQNLYHPNLPQMVGFSDESTPAPFVVLAKVKLRNPNAYVWSKLQKENIAECAAMMLRMYRDVTSATLYVQRQMSLDEGETQDFVSDASYSLDGDGNVIVGLPPPKNKHTITIRSYGLIESLVSTCMQTLPSIERLQSLQGTSDAAKQIELQNKFLHVKSLTRSLLPSQTGSSLTLSESVNEVLDEFEDDTVSLSRLRELYAQTTHGEADNIYAWSENISNCRVKLVAGDLGYISSADAVDGRVDMMDKSRFRSFVKIGNIAQILTPGQSCGVASGNDIPKSNFRSAEYDMSVVKETSGTQMQWVNGFLQRQTVYPFLLPSEIEGWSVLLQPQLEISVHVRHQIRLLNIAEAWRYLLREARQLAKSSGADVKPHEIILITRSSTSQVYIAKHFGQPPLLPGRQPFNNNMAHNRPGTMNAFPSHPFGAGHPFPHHNFQTSHHTFLQPPPLPGQGPQMLHLFTSPRPDFEPFWAEDPSIAMLPAEHRRPIPRFVTTRVSWPGSPDTSIDYVQLSREDFE